jgi:hypothetical protein
MIADMTIRTFLGYTHFALVYRPARCHCTIGLTLMHYESARNAIEALRQRDSTFDLFGADTPSSQR